MQQRPLVGLVGFCALLLSSPVASLLTDDAEDAIQSSVELIESTFSELFTYDDTVWRSCAFYDACDDPPYSSLDCEVIPNWQRCNTSYFEMCDENAAAETYPESPDCPAVASTTCSLDLSLDHATTKFLTNTDFDSLDVQRSVCVLEQLDSLWERDHQQVLNIESYPELIYASVGGTGAFVQFPGTEWTECPDSYDPRFRPWYSNAATGPKNVILVIDTSGSMSGSRLSLAKSAAIKVLGTLNDYDYVGLVDFDGSARKYSSTMKQFSSNERCLLEDYINDLTALGSTDYVDAFDAAFDIYDASVLASRVAPCDTTAILFLTDGEHIGDAADPPNRVQQRNADGKVRILTYGLGSSTSMTMLNELACENGGVAYHVQDDGDLGDVMASYYSLFAAEIVPSSVRPVWTKYRAWTTGTFVVSVCMSAFLRGDGNVSTLYGVACADVVEEHFADLGQSSSIATVLAESAAYCPSFTASSESHLELIRSTLPGNPLSCVDGSTYPSAAVVEGGLVVTSSCTFDPADIPEDNCESESESESEAQILWWYWGIPVIVVGVVIIVGVSVFAAKRCKKKTTEPRPNSKQGGPAPQYQPKPQSVPAPAPAPSPAPAPAPAPASTSAADTPSVVFMGHQPAPAPAPAPAPGYYPPPAPAPAPGYYPPPSAQSNSVYMGNSHAPAVAVRPPDVAETVNLNAGSPSQYGRANAPDGVPLARIASNQFT